MNLRELSIEEIRARLQENQLVTGHFLNRLKRDPREGVRKVYELLKKRYEKERTERLRIQNMLNFERLLWKSGVQFVAGVDEVGVHGQRALVAEVGAITHRPYVVPVEGGHTIQVIVVRRVGV